MESERQHHCTEREGGGMGGRLFLCLIKERIHRDVLGVCNAALRIKEEQSAKKNKIKNRKKKEIVDLRWRNTTPPEFARRTFCTFIVLCCASVIFNGSHGRDNAPNWPTA